MVYLICLWYVRICEVSTRRGYYSIDIFWPCHYPKLFYAFKVTGMAVMVVISKKGSLNNTSVNKRLSACY